MADTYQKMSLGVAVATAKFHNKREGDENPIISRIVKEHDRGGKVSSDERILLDQYNRENNA